MTKKYTTEEFIERAKKVHGEEFDYSKFINVPLVRIPYYEFNNIEKILIEELI